jgi:hypothetical protein
MIKRTVRAIMGYFRPPSPLGVGATVCAAAILALSVSLVIPPVPRAFAQPGSGGENQTKGSLPSAATPRLQRSQQTTKGGHASLLPYDIRSKIPASQLSGGFHNSKDLFLHSTPAGASNIHPLRLSHPSGTCPSTITQSTSQAVVTGAVACRTQALALWRTITGAHLI